MSPRQRQIVSQVLDGRRNREIAASLGIAEQSVKNYLARAYRQLGVHSTRATVLDACSTELQTAYN